MARIKIELPDNFIFTTDIAIRITDLNYGGHVGNDTVLSIIHEARVRFLKHHGFEELNAGGTSLIMSDVAIGFKQEIFYGDTLSVAVTANDFSRVGFDIFYRLQKQSGDKIVNAAIAKTGMVCYNYALKKIVQVPDEVKDTLMKRI